MAGMLDEPKGGLLDFFASPAGQGLLSAVGAGLAGARRGAPLNAIGAGMLGGLQGYANAQDQQAQMKRMGEQSDWMKTQRDWMTQDRARAEDAAKRSQEAFAARQGYLGSVGRVTSPVVGAAPNQFDPMKWMQLGGSVEEAKSLASSGNWGKSAIKDYKEIRNPDGSVSIVGFDEYGNQKQTGATPFKDAKFQDFGGYFGSIDPITGKVTKLGNKTMTPEGSDASRRGWASIQLQAQNQTKPEFKDGQWVTPPRDMKPGETRTVVANQGVKDANDAIALITEARKILPQSTGSYGGWLYDQGARVIGSSTDGAKAAAQLKAIGGMLTAKMPKMSGPQSNADVEMYREMAGRVGDSTLPIDERMAALDAVEKIQMRYASGMGGASGEFSSGASSGWSIKPKGGN